MWIGLSTHEYKDWDASIQIAYRRAARTFERHSTSNDEGKPVRPIASLPAQLDLLVHGVQPGRG